MKERHKIIHPRWIKQLAMIVLVFLFYLILGIIQSIVSDIPKVDLRLMILVVVVINIIAINRIIKLGFEYFQGDKRVDRILSISFGLLSYLLFMWQLGLVFFYYYVYYKGYGVVPKTVANEFLLERTDFVTDLRLIVNFVFPFFYRFPNVQGIMVVIQFFIGKFADLFILAFIVQRIRGSKS